MEISSEISFEGKKKPSRKRGPNIKYLNFTWFLVYQGRSHTLDYQGRGPRPAYSKRQASLERTSLLNLLSRPLKVATISLVLGR